MFLGPTCSVGLLGPSTWVSHGFTQRVTNDGVKPLSRMLAPEIGALML